MTGRVTMLGIAHWAGHGGSDRTVQRFVSQALPWAMLCWVCCRQPVDRADEVSLLGGDAGVATKAGTRTSGLDRCCASLSGKPVPGLAFCTLSRVRVPARRSVPRRVEPVVRSAAEQAASTASADAKTQQPPTATRRPGRPKGSTTPPHS